MSQFAVLSSKQSVMDWFRAHDAGHVLRGFVSPLTSPYTYFDAGNDNAIFRFEVESEHDARARYYEPFSRRQIKAPVSDSTRMAFWFDENNDRACLFVLIPDMPKQMILNRNDLTIQDTFNAWIAGAYKETGALTAKRSIDAPPPPPSSVYHDLRLDILSPSAISDTEFAAFRKLCSNCNFMAIRRREHDSLCHLRITASDQDEMAWLRREFAADRLTSTLEHIKSFMSKIGKRDNKPKPGASVLTLDTLHHIYEFAQLAKISDAIPHADGVSLTLNSDGLLHSSLAVTVANVETPAERAHLAAMFESCRAHAEVHRPMERLILNRRYGPPITESDVKIVKERLASASETKRAKVIECLRKMGVPSAKHVGLDLRQKRYLKIFKITAKEAAKETVKASTVPETHEELKELAEQTKLNTNTALQSLKDELRRMSGKIVMRDHTPLADVGGDAVPTADMYTLDQEVLRKQLEAAQEASDSDSDSYSEEEVMAVEPVPEPVTKRHRYVSVVVERAFMESTFETMVVERAFMESTFETVVVERALMESTFETVVVERALMESTFETVVVEPALVSVEPLVKRHCNVPEPAAEPDYRTWFLKYQLEKQAKDAEHARICAQRDEARAKRKRDEKAKLKAMEDQAKKNEREYNAKRIAVDAAPVGTAICLTLEEEKEHKRMEKLAAKLITDISDEEWLKWQRE